MKIDSELKILQPPASSLQPPASFSFAAFMQEALYHPEHGYYASGRVRIGKKGDFFTNVSVGKIYGHVLTFLFEEVWKSLGSPPSFLIVEQGAHDGRLAHDILESLSSATGERSLFAKSVQYAIVEPFQIHQERQQETLKTFRNVSWFSGNQELPPFEGIHFSNELIDAFPVHLLLWDGSSWLEKRVVSDDGKFFSWTTAPLEQEELCAIAEQLPKNLAPGFLWEVRLGIKPWLSEIATRMKRGVLLIADYGYSGQDRFAPYRAEGSIACYQDHRRYDNPLEEPGKRDISAHVDFTALAETASALQWELLGYSDQHHFLMGAAEQWLRSCEGKSDTATQRDLRLLQTLLHPETMGRSFKFLGLGKGMISLAPLSGFRYQRPGVTGL